MDPNRDLIPSLPVELQLHISSYLDYGAALKFCSTSRYYYSTFSCPPSERKRFVHQLEMSPEHSESLACYRCFRVLPKGQFTDRQTKHPRNKSGRDGFRRFCFKCGVKDPTVSSHGTVFMGGLRLVVCEECEMPTQRCIYCGQCKGCSGLKPDSSGGLCPGCGFKGLVVPWEVELELRWSDLWGSGSDAYVSEEEDGSGEEDSGLEDAESDGYLSINPFLSLVG